MFDRSDADTMRVVDSAIHAARRLGHNYIGTEHLLLALAEQRDVLPPPVGPLLPDVEAVRSALAAVAGEPLRRDAELLGTFGIDLDEVRSAVRRTLATRRSTGSAVAGFTNLGNRGAVRRGDAPHCWREP